MQHGHLDEEQALNMLRGFSRHRDGPRCGGFIRVPGNDMPQVGKALDQGADGIICPLVNNAAEARHLVEACYYPPHGVRSWGPSRALLGGGSIASAQVDFDAGQPSSTKTRPVVLAMVETKDGLASIEDICAVPLLYGIFIGPFDLSVAMGEPLQGPQGTRTKEAIARILATFKRNNKRCGIFSTTPEHAKGFENQGSDVIVSYYDMATISGTLAASAKASRDPSGGPAVAAAYSSAARPAAAANLADDAEWVARLQNMDDAGLEEASAEARALLRSVRQEQQRRRGGDGAGAPPAKRDRGDAPSPPAARLLRRLQ